LRGDIRFTNEQYDMAIQNYDIAIRRRDGFFQYYLQRGLANEKLGNNQTAITDLETSNELFPTAIAHYALGNIAAEQGDKQEAIEHYTMVAGGVRCFQDNNGNLGISIGNATPLTITGVRYVVQYRDAIGTQTREGAVSGQIRAGTTANVSTGIGPYPADSGCPVQIIAARVVE
jgi:hypothetical protein